MAGAVESATTWDAAALASRPHATVEGGIHDAAPQRWSGVPLRALLTRAGVPEGGDIRGPLMRTVVVVKALDGYSALFALPELDDAFTDRVTVLADQVDGRPLPPEEGPFRIVVPGEKRGARWVRQVACLRVVRVE